MILSFIKQTIIKPLSQHTLDVNTLIKPASNLFLVATIIPIRLLIFLLSVAFINDLEAPMETSASGVETLVFFFEELESQQLPPARKEAYKLLPSPLKLPHRGT